MSKGKRKRNKRVNPENIGTSTQVHLSHVKEKGRWDWTDMMNANGRAYREATWGDVRACGEYSMMFIVQKQKV